ncbi:MAG: O-antigen ligase family protein [Rhizomicrobium sp.]
MTFDQRLVISRRLENAAFYLLLLVVALAPLPFGSNGPESTWILSGASGAVLLLVALAGVLDPARYPSFGAPLLVAALACFAAVGVWALVQMMPGLPAPLPHPLWAERARILGIEAGGTISIDPDLTLAALAKSAGYFAIGAATLFLLRDASRRRTACTVLAMAGGVYAAYGLVTWAAGDCCVVWQKKTAYLGVVTGPFINRNSFATYLGLVALVPFGLLLRGLGELRRVAAASVFRRLATRLQLLLVDHWAMIVVLLLLVDALLCTLSRAGITSAILGAATLVLLASQAGVFGSKRRRVLHLAAFAGIVTLTLAIFGGALLGRIADEGVEDVDRTQSWKIIVSGIEASPWLGHGFGTFPEAFPLYRDDRLASRRYWDKAQDTYLELALDLGVPATAVLLGGFAALLAQCAKGLSRRRRERRIFPAIGIAATVLIAAHSVYDFSMQIPAVATTFAFIIAIALAESGLWRGRGADQSSAT